MVFHRSRFVSNNLEIVQMENIPNKKGLGFVKKKEGKKRYIYAYMRWYLRWFEKAYVLILQWKHLHVKGHTVT